MKCSSMEASLSSQGAQIASRSTILQQGYKMCLQDRYDKESNPQGFINLGTSENKICFDLLHDRLTKPDMSYLEPSLLEYNDTRGIKSLREEVAKFLSHYCRAPAPLSPDNVIIMNGCRSIFCALSNVILNPGDSFLIPTPYYALIKDFMSTYTKAHPVEVPLCSKITETERHPFQLTIMKLENAIKKAMKEGVNIRALILINPQNPLGEIYSKELLVECLKFGQRYNLHVIIDELYMLSIFNNATFTSLLSLRESYLVSLERPCSGLSNDTKHDYASCQQSGDIGVQRNPLPFIRNQSGRSPHVLSSESVNILWDLNGSGVPDPEKTHFIWGVSKDFAMSGMAVGVLYTKNQHVLKSMTYLGLFHQCSGPTQHVISRLLSDREWLDGTFFPINKQRLKASQLILVNGLQELGIPVLRSSAGLYVWADFRKFLTSQTFEAEMELWWTLLREKLYIAPGKAFECCEPGWFRLTFSLSSDILEKCIMKLRKLLQDVPEDDLKN